jgi:hypothetical protein
MARHKKTKGFLFVVQKLALIPFLHLRKWGIYNPLTLLGHNLKKAELAVRAILLDLLADFNGFFQHRHHLRTFCAGGIKGTAFNQALNHPPVDLSVIHPFAEVK